MHAVPYDSTVVAGRSSNLLLSPFIIYSSGNRSVDVQGQQYGHAMQQGLANASGKPLNAYVKYASGFESQEALFGYEGWRLERLRWLKREYDPQGCFDYCAAIET